jgi:RNA polymerase sigma factor (sigma-70 family)
VGYGKNISFADSFLQHRKALIGYVSRIVSANEAEDIVQATYVKIQTNKDQNIRAPRALMFMTARNLAVDYLRHHKISAIQAVPDIEAVISSDSPPDPEQNALARERFRVFCEALEALPTQQRRVFTLRKVYNLSHPEIADELGIAVNTIQKHLTKAIKTVSAFMAERLDETALPSHSEGANNVVHKDRREYE